VSPNYFASPDNLARVVCPAFLGNSCELDHDVLRVRVRMHMKASDQSLQSKGKQYAKTLRGCRDIEHGNSRVKSLLQVVSPSFQLAPSQSGLSTPGPNSQSQVWTRVCALKVHGE
jgi:hypothetical protein